MFPFGAQVRKTDLLGKYGGSQGSVFLVPGENMRSESAGLFLTGLLVQYQTLHQKIAWNMVS